MVCDPCRAAHTVCLSRVRRSPAATTSSTSTGSRPAASECVFGACAGELQSSGRPPSAEHTAVASHRYRHNTCVRREPYPQDERPKLTDIVLDPASGKMVSLTTLSPLDVDFPVVHPDLATRRTRYVWGATMDFDGQLPLFIGIAKVRGGSPLHVSGSPHPAACRSLTLRRRSPCARLSLVWRSLTCRCRRARSRTRAWGTLSTRPASLEGRPSLCRAPTRRPVSEAGAQQTSGPETVTDTASDPHPGLTPPAPSIPRMLVRPQRTTVGCSCT